MTGFELGLQRVCSLAELKVRERDEVISTAL